MRFGNKKVTNLNTEVLYIEEVRDMLLITRVRKYIINKLWLLRAFRNKVCLIKQM